MAIAPGAGDVAVAVGREGPVMGASSAGAASRVIQLITGQVFRLSESAKGVPAVAVGGGVGGGGGGGALGSLVTIQRGGRSYAIPAAALPYLGHGLDPSLFDVHALERAEGADRGRLPVSIRYSGSGLAPVPGITVTSAAGGLVSGYLTAASEKKFGRALDRQFVVDRSEASYGTDGLFAGDLTIGLLGGAVPTVPASAAPARPLRPQYQMRTLTVTGSYRDGRPDTGDLALLANVDNSGRLDILDSEAAFYHGIAKFSVPAGHYFAIGLFFGPSSNGAPFPAIHGLDIVPQFTVAGNTRLHLNEKAASSPITMVTPRPAKATDTSFLVFRRPRTGARQFFGFINFRWLGDNVPLWVSPTTKRPGIGTMATIVDERLASPAKAAPYEYDLAYQNLRGLIPPQRYVVRASRLAVIKARYYLAGHGGFLSRVSSFPLQLGQLAFSYDPVNAPGTRTIYSSAAADLIWTTSLYTAAGRFPGRLIQTDQARIYHPGEHVTENWNDYPLHPTPNVDLIGGRGLRGGFLTLPSASRSGNTLILDFAPFGDNTPGHAGVGFSNQSGTSKVAGTYEVDQNGKKISSGDAAKATGGGPDLRLLIPLSPARSTIKFTLTAALGGRAGTSPQPSGQSQTTWTWTSSHESGHHLPIGWWCLSADPSCRVEPLLALDYSIPNLSARGQTSPGRQLINLDVGHLPLAKAAKITKAAVQVSYDGGHTWGKAQVTGRSGLGLGFGRFRAAFAAPAGAWVTLRTHAQDAAGSAITETITDAYRVAPRPAVAPRRVAVARRAAVGPRPATRAAACPVAKAGQLRCLALYSRQSKVDAEIAARTAAASVAPKGWGALDLQSAYKLPVSTDPGQTVAVVDAYRTPDLASSLATYRAQYGLPACSTSTGCLRIVNQSGAATPLPVSAVPFGWDVETTLDVEMVSAACPLCKILVVEARSNKVGDLAIAENTAARLGAQVISDSFGGAESGLNQTHAKAYNHPGHVIVAASGDLGFTTASFPANQPAVTAVGGTELAKSTNQRGWTEQAWNQFDGASGSGCSAYVPKPKWQHDRHCDMRTVADVSAVAANLAVFDQARRGWLLVGGTSAAAPLVAGIYALAGNATTITPGYEYRHAKSLFDVTTGNNDNVNGTGGRTCGFDYLCVAGKGYDAPTGLGTPHGTGAF
ncbi:MAG TPA: S53 family peptidase [Streptosporangiaceae bacterium]|nr:S53 family peptidase [Streptosporangiaceae bacterium]